jgi:cytochrome c-type biogenesis protein CcmF
MDIGKIGILIGLAASLLSIFFYLLSIKTKRSGIMAGRIFFGLAGCMSFFAFFRLMILIANHDFTYKYVFDYSSANLEPPFLYAATWAGQQGSFLLWAVWTVVIGGILIWKSGNWENRIMPVYVTILVFLFGILHWLSPFELIHRGAGINDWPLNLPWPPPDGAGLNPSLQNYWMAIHPPTIFFGFASLAVPFAFAIAAMIWKQYDRFAVKVMPFVLLTIATLGVGLFMGGYWAYETQGWHGFWAWDPVENASLFPWLGALALLHGLIVQKQKGGMVRTNLILAITSWLLFIYGTFLTRSGVLANFSVHAFGMLDNDALKLLIAMIVLYGVGGFLLLAYRWKGITGKPVSDSMLSRDAALTIAVSLMICAAIVITLGTSWPLISRWGFLRYFGLYNPTGTAVGRIYYNRIGSILLIPALISMGLVPWLAWNRTSGEKLIWKILPAWFCALAAGFLIILFARSQAGSDFEPTTPLALVIAIGGLGVFAAVSNGILIFTLLKGKVVTIGGWLSHVGIGLLLLGTILTNVYERSETRTIIEGMGPVRTGFGYALSFAGWTHDNDTPEQIRKDWLRFDHALKLQLIPINAQGELENASNGAGAASKPIIGNVSVFHYWQQDHWATMTWPLIYKLPFRDIYISAADDPTLVRVKATLAPGETSTVSDLLRNPGYQVHYKRFQMIGQPGQLGTIMRADMDLITPSGRKIPIEPGLKLGGQDGPQPVNEDIPELNGAVLMDSSINPATKEVTVAFELPEAPALWTAPITITNKPFINFVWIGVLLMGLGALISMLRRAMEAGKSSILQQSKMNQAQKTSRRKVSAAGNRKEDHKPAISGSPGSRNK